MSQGFMLVPSDTCYSLATYAAFDTTFENVNKVLDRGAEPISLACSSYEEATSWMAHNTAALAILQHFTPGPITMVVRASDRIREHASFFDRVINSQGQTIGLRVPDSVIERQVSETSDVYLTTTTAVIDPDTNAGVRDFQRAYDLVRSGIQRIGGAGWGAVEGRDFYARRSTVVKVNDDYSVEEIRAGDISMEDIRSVSEMMPSRYFDDWG